MMGVSINLLVSVIPILIMATTEKSKSIEDSKTMTTPFILADPTAPSFTMPSEFQEEGYTSHMTENEEDFTTLTTLGSYSGDYERQGPTDSLHDTTTEIFKTMDKNNVHLDELTTLTSLHPNAIEGLTTLTSIPDNNIIEENITHLTTAETTSIITEELLEEKEISVSTNDNLLEATIEPYTETSDSIFENPTINLDSKRGNNRAPDKQITTLVPDFVEKSKDDLFSVYSLLDDETELTTFINDGRMRPEGTPPATFLQLQEMEGEPQLEIIGNGEISSQENTIPDIRHRVQDFVEDIKPIDLKITTNPSDMVVFRKGIVIGLSCSAFSKTDNDIEYSWTKNGKFMETETERIFRESRYNGNLIILRAGPSDVGLYQCVASNSEGVVFSRVVKVKLLPSSSWRGRGRALSLDRVVYVSPRNRQLESEEEALKLHIVTPRNIL